SAVSKWVKENPWVIEYAVFMELKRQFNEASWKTWPKEFRKITKEKILERWQDENLLENHLFFAWLQLRASEQFKEASDYIASRGIILKGDIPIMMNEDSADAWAHPEFFDDKMRAGSPPDGFNPLGQNWGFPIYRWDNLEKDGYSWWKNRLICASKYYKAYRIDHVLGFFRIWATSDHETTATMGMTLPSSCITLAELEKAGFDKDRIRWLSQPHVPTKAIEEVNNNDYLGTHGILNKVMDRIGQEELWLFKPEIKGDKDIWENSEIPEPVKARLAEFWRNRTLVLAGSGKFVPLWTYKETTAWQSLTEEEKEALEKILAKKSEKQDKLWEAQARKILGELTSSTDMIACAEDLGANPECLPQVLSDLSILRLSVVRWYRDWAEEGQPFINFEDYPENSVATASVHDSSTLRLWWLEENDSPAFIRDFPPETKDGKIIEKVYTPETAAYLLKKMAAAASRFCIHPIQDFLSLSALYYNDNPKLEVVNVPGSVNEFNWTYRLPVTVEKLSADKDLIASIKSVVNLHK
ncbi:MAG: 4-alpha-glucanotransferase, partial [Spirochaetaceae bacterium]|nr:4-alpha-glucanotransferase [Spirochaetaceae bacterium]